MHSGSTKEHRQAFSLRTIMTAMQRVLALAHRSSRVRSAPARSIALAMPQRGSQAGTQHGTLSELQHCTLHDTLPDTLTVTSSSTQTGTQTGTLLDTLTTTVHGSRHGTLSTTSPVVLPIALSVALPIVLSLAMVSLTAEPLHAAPNASMLYTAPPAKPIDSKIKVSIGDRAPDFELPTTRGDTVRLSAFRGKHHVVLSFVPAAFTPVCSAQWPGYDMLRDAFAKYDAVLIGITTDNVASLHAWTSQMGTDPAGQPGSVWFTVASDFWPHGATAEKYGVLRSDGIAERALFVIDRDGIIRHIDVTDINRRPPVDVIFKALDAIKSR